MDTTAAVAAAAANTSTPVSGLSCASSVHSPPHRDGHAFFPANPCVARAVSLPRTQVTGGGGHTHTRIPTDL